jgi:O-succinylbenzoic acid--CoA ligase
MDPLARAADERPEGACVDVGGVAWTYEEVDGHATRIARRLAGAGLGEDRTVATLLPNGAKVGWALHGVPRAGATLAPLDTRWTERELVSYLRRVRPAAVLTDGQLEPLAGRVVQQANLVSLDQPSSPRALHLQDLPAEEGPLPGPEAADPHTVLPTSGTTGEPEAACFDLDTHLTHARAAADRLDLGAGDRWLATLAPAHVGGLALWLRAAVLGATVVAVPGFDADHVARLVDEDEVTHASLVPTMLHHLLDARDDAPAPDGFELALVGGAACPRPLLERALDAGWPVALTYGLTEAASQVCTAPPDLVRAEPGTVGEPLDEVEVRIGERDEVLVRGPTLFEGYLGEDETPVDDDGWLATGDAGRLDDEGRLWITGRLSDRIVSGGLTVDPVQVEGALAEHPGVEAVGVVGLPDEEWGERVAAAVVEREPGTLEPTVLREFLEERLSDGKHPRAWAFVDELPTTARGKLDRDALRDRLEGA